MSVFRGRLSVEEAFKSVVGWPPDEDEKRDRAVRYARAGKIREVGLAVVHTPGRRPSSGHCTLVWAEGSDAMAPSTPWPPRVCEDLETCFNEETGRC